jgi:hypothetical protein
VTTHIGEPKSSHSISSALHLDATGVGGIIRLPHELNAAAARLVVVKPFNLGLMDGLGVLRDLISGAQKCFAGLGEYSLP